GAGAGREFFGLRALGSTVTDRGAHFFAPRAAGPELGASASFGGREPAPPDAGPAYRCVPPDLRGGRRFARDRGRPLRRLLPAGRVFTRARNHRALGIQGSARAGRGPGRGAPRYGEPRGALGAGG